MARKLRIEFSGAIYHVTIRGVGRSHIFSDDNDRDRFIDRLAAYGEDHRIRVYMFCLMSNHVHLLVETPEGNLGRFMHRLETAYTVYFNLRHNRSGHLFQGRYGAVLVEGDEYLLKMSRYLHLNPVKTRRLEGLPLKDKRDVLRRYQWSSYPSYIGRRKRLPWIDYDPMLSLVGGRKRNGATQYRNFVEAGLAETDEEFKRLYKGGGLSLGSEEFMAQMRDLHIDLTEKFSKKEDVTFRKMRATLDREAVIGAVCQALECRPDDLRGHKKRSPLKAIASKMLCKHAGLTQREAAEVLALTSGASVCIQLSKLEGYLEEDKALAKVVARLDHGLATRQGLDI